VSRVPARGRAEEQFTANTMAMAAGIHWADAMGWAMCRPRTRVKTMLPTVRARW